MSPPRGLEGPCHCGHAPEEHGGDPRYPGNTGCMLCECLAYEENEAGLDGEGEPA